MIKQIFYAGLITVGLTIGTMACSTVRYDDSPTQVKLENVQYHQDQTGNPVCIYDNNGKLVKRTGGHIGSIFLGYNVVVNDQNHIREIRQNWRGHKNNEPSRYDKGKYKEEKFTYSVFSPDGDFLEDHPLEVVVFDWLGNKIKRDFTLQDFLKVGKPFTIGPVDNSTEAQLEQLVTKNSIRTPSDGGTCPTTIKK